MMEVAVRYSRKILSRSARFLAIGLMFGGLIMPLAIAATPAHAEQPIAPEKNPPGDIPDSQVFVTYASPLGFSLKIPEGWARSDRADGVSFVDKLNGIAITVTKAADAPTLSNVKSDYVQTLEKAGHAVKVSEVKTIQLPSGQAIQIVYSSNSAPNPVTSKQVRLENNRYLYFKDGKLVALDLYAPFGADNVDQWQLMSRSFQWN